MPITVPGADDQALVGFLYEAVGSPRRRVLQVLLHGNSYDHRYWDAGLINGRDYSYANYMTNRGFDILAVDLPGVGASTKPAGHVLTLVTVGRAITELFARLREPGKLVDRSYDHITLIGHSLGAMVAVFVEAQAATADSLLVMGVGFYPGRKSSGWAPGDRQKFMNGDYATLPPEARQKFYYDAQVDPAVIAFDNSTLRTSIPSQLWADTIDLRDGPVPPATNVKCPVYVQLGEHDPIMLGAYAVHENACYPSAAAVEVECLPDMGHCFNLHLNRERSWQGVDRYLKSSLL